MRVAPPSPNGWRDDGADGWVNGAGPYDGADPTGRDAATASGPVDGAEASAEEVPIELHGPSGREVMATFSLENTEQRPVEMVFEAGPCEGPGDESFIAPVTVSPARFTIDPGGTRTVAIRVVMLPSVFVPGHLYRMAVHGRGPTNLVLRLTIWAEEPDNGVAPIVEEPSVRAVPSGDAAAEVAADDEPMREHYLVRCPACRRDFERDTPSTRLYPHKTSDGEACPERRGRSRRR